MPAFEVYGESSRVTIDRTSNSLKPDERAVVGTESTAFATECPAPADGATRNSEGQKRKAFCELLRWAGLVDRAWIETPHASRGRSSMQSAAISVLNRTVIEAGERTALDRSNFGACARQMRELDVALAATSLSARERASVRACAWRILEAERFHARVCSGARRRERGSGCRRALWPNRPQSIAPLLAACVLDRFADDDADGAARLRAVADSLRRRRQAGSSPRVGADRGLEVSLAWYARAIATDPPSAEVYNQCEGCELVAVASSGGSSASERRSASSIALSLGNLSRDDSVDLRASDRMSRARLVEVQQLMRSNLFRAQTLVAIASLTAVQRAVENECAGCERELILAHAVGMLQLRRRKWDTVDHLVPVDEDQKELANRLFSHLCDAPDVIELLGADAVAVDRPDEHY